MITKGRNRNIRIHALCLMTGTMLSALSMTTPAQAGFNWTPPPAPPKAAPAPAAATTAAPDAAMAPMAPVDAEPAPQAAPAPAPVAAAPASAPEAVAATSSSSASSGTVPGTVSTPPAETASAEKISWTPAETAAPAPEAAAAVPAAPAESASAGYKEVKGFGKDIPLAMAMNQIVPSDYAYSFAPEINPGTSISWQGDKPWDVVLNDALQPAGLVAVIKNSSVRIEKAAPDAAAPAVTGASAPAPQTYGAAPHYTQEQLAAIGMNTGNDNPVHYQRHQPRYKDDKAARNAAVVIDQTAPGTPASAPPPPNNMNAPAANTTSQAQDSPVSLTGNPDQSQPTQSVASLTISSDINTVASWQAKQGQSLHDTLTAWCGQSGVNLIWQANQDYKLPQALDTKGTFTDAVRDVLTAYNGSKSRPVGQLHPNLPKGPPVLVIQNESGA